MSALRKAAQQALEALERSETTVQYEGFGVARRDAERKHQAAIDALRAALAEPTSDTLPPLPKRLRTFSADPELSDRYSDAMLEAADEIERLRECLQWLQEKHHGGLMRAKIAEALGAAAVAAERERCAELMERQHTWISNVSAARLIRGSTHVLMTGYVDEAAAVAEPVAWLIEYEGDEREVRFVAGTRGIRQTPLYTAPPQQKENNDD